MRYEVTFKLRADEIRNRMLRARLRAENAAVTQDRQLFDGMAKYWEELLSQEEDPVREREWVEA